MRGRIDVFGERAAFSGPDSRGNVLDFTAIAGGDPELDKRKRLRPGASQAVLQTADM